MTSWLRTAIRAAVAPSHRLRCRKGIWDEGLAELRRRGDGRRESGAFLLGRVEGDRRVVERFVYYDDVDPRALDTGIIRPFAMGLATQLLGRGVGVVAGKLLADVVFYVPVIYTYERRRRAGR